MMNKHTGGPAFAIPGRKFVDEQNFTKYSKDWPGMTLRDYFAAKALNGILSDPDAGLLNEDLDRYAVISYRAADAMIKERNK